MKTSNNEPEMLEEYDFSKARKGRGRYAERYASGTNIVVLDPDVAREFPTSASVNAALRSLLGKKSGPRKEPRRK